ncbi:putative inorganic carbon (hco3(-)) transporter [Sporobacter termitidis DSM 10068]|uniref:Putative inorganic carbon (Hco3(-)) transporter n=1 Tax=Sporobacter termitidis DSM 10068 TaxID=1123282 RepID=A0A1M5WXR1_9FIRM|nr:O-antigen ligase family protein [Sporobacter termitidis]SHH92152.1 putative inorganic carbon (hco3(-)) transporter [Sporobacter termitidis DSM 10068]
MQEIFKSSIFLRWLTAFFSWVGVMWHRSRIVSWFLSPGRGRALTDNSVFSKLFGKLHGAVCVVFEKLRLNRLFEGSIFKQAFFGCLLPAVLAPFLPTMVVLCLVIVGVFTLFVRFGTDRSLRLFYSPVNKYILLFCAVYLVATLTSVTVSGSLFTGLITVLFALFAIAFDNAVTTKKQADLAVRLIVVAGTAVALYGIYQYIFYNPATAGAWVDSDMFSGITNRVYSTLGNPNVLSEYLLLVMPFAAACVLTGKTWWQRVFFLCCLAVMAVCMIVTFSRGGYLGLILAAVIFIVMLDARFILLGIVALVALYFFLPQTVTERFSSIGNLSDSSTSYRVYIWMGTIAMLKDYWFSGIGPGTNAFNLIYPAYSYNTIAAPHAHNLFLQIMCDSGIVGLILFVAILFSYYRRTFTAFSRTRDKTSRTYLIAAIASVSAFLLQGMTDYAFYNNCVMLLFWIFIGLGAIMARRPEMEEGPLWLKS